MLTFLLFTVITWFAGNCVLKIYFMMIQQGEALDILFGWQKMLAKLYNGNQAQQLLGKALGDCEKCFAFWFMPLWFGVYYTLCRYLLGEWVTDYIKSDSGFIKWFILITWYSIFHSTGAITGLWALTKFKKKDGV